ncbi:hypothetical protein [Nocardia africana]|uniref:Uncharacterized protein n=1 Tax=Nocardia africana TaxID=134964 RepID=A0A379X4W8_9NOCA|nr:hypothetical protein [Nocardia africana]MCC3318469.1 hypothetical protein [Nocardia africana]SUH71977.1 Uncharacterised protein [Nocardia africana]
MSEIDFSTRCPQKYRTLRPPAPGAVLECHAYHRHEQWVCHVLDGAQSLAADRAWTAELRRIATLPDAMRRTEMRRQRIHDVDADLIERFAAEHRSAQWQLLDRLAELAGQFDVSQNPQELCAQYYARRAAGDSEQIFRAQFALACRFNAAYWANGGIGDEPMKAVADAIEWRWREQSGPEGRADWDYLADAVHDWEQAPASMARLVEQIAHDEDEGARPLSPTQRRSIMQARELTGHGAWEA